MKITSVQTYAVGLGFRNCLFVRIDTDAGITGWAETVFKRKTKTIEQGVHELARYLVGQDPMRIEDHWEKMYRDSFWVGGPMHTTPLSVVEIALWDIKGKALGVPVYQLLGGPTRDRILVYAHCPAGATPEEFAANGRAVVTRGYKAMKTTLPVFYGAKRTVAVKTAEGTSEAARGYSGTWGVLDRSLKETEFFPSDTIPRIREFFVALREAVGPSTGLMVDCHGRLSPANSIRLCEALADLNLMFIEEPVPPENAEALAKVAEASSTSIAAGERWATIYGARDFIVRQAVAVAQPDVVNCGGLAQAKKIAALAEAYYIGIAPHNPNGPLATVAAMHLAASIPNFLILETIGSDEDKAIQAEVSRPALRFEDGHLLLPEGPGLGVEPVPEAFEQYPYQPFEGWR
ncbi:MAG: mandelate racemase/muconate lactonizing enzyme family protein [Anaerolineae bacterium]|nr:mandelate racemase/muconate lactonizing enzyme family protein [Anaerolineae bacterium]